MHPMLPGKQPPPPACPLLLPPYSGAGGPRWRQLDSQRPGCRPLLPLFELDLPCAHDGPGGHGAPCERGVALALPRPPGSLPAHTPPPPPQLPLPSVACPPPPRQYVLLYWFGGWPALVWAGAVRQVLMWHVTWLVNSACHMWGSRPYATPDLSTNCWQLALPTFGESWHNNHHAVSAVGGRGGLELPAVAAWARADQLLTAPLLPLLLHLRSSPTAPATAWSGGRCAAAGVA